jgi:hypothetical protein
MIEVNGVCVCVRFEVNVIIINTLYYSTQSKSVRFKAGNRY